MVTYNQYKFIDQLTEALAVSTERSKAALTRMEKALNDFKLERGLPPSILHDESVLYDRAKYAKEISHAEPWKCFKGVSSNAELAYDLALMQRLPGGLSKDNLAALALLLKSTKRTPSNKDGLLNIAHQIAFNALCALVPNQGRGHYQKTLGQRYGAKLSRDKRVAKAKLEHEKRLSWAKLYIEKHGPRNARKAIEIEFKISPRTASTVLSDLKKLGN